MAKPKKDASGSGMGEWKGIANVAIDDSHKERAKALLLAKDEIVEGGLGDLLASDYKMVIRWDDRSDCPMVSLSCYNEESPNFKMTLITRAPSWRLALILTWIKHYEICDGVWSGTREDNSWG